MKAKQALIPKDGFNLVGVDDMEVPGEELYLIGHFSTRAAAEAARAAKKKERPELQTYIYDPTTK